MNTVQIIGILASIFTTVAVLPQIIKAVKRKSVADVSPLMFSILCLGVALWVVYGILKRDWPIIICNAISLLFNGIMLYIMISSPSEEKKEEKTTNELNV
ncbi:SemiSWEET transporter [Tamlana sp. 2_MG-2023]|uniref:SemiSWEET family sugar transporter n=1 Tax=unclassified Tamlana TaxID=2614803 RepID=UPI0026E1657C|nr:MULTISPECIES: SemiSWEET transporter [unclassified Tamlana]MDO6760201.1 SemiSWEET transporter [Tamlana sp. 2_MG-2023]MDO6790101.1 SemiSWEET transporter [Tamlana sp. 1_MG-2023]